MIVKAWNEVAHETIRHCWEHTQIVSAPTIALLRQHDEPRKSIDLLELSDLMQKLALPGTMHAVEYLTCDDELDEWQPEDELDSLDTGSCSNEEDENIPLSHREALNAAVQLSTYMFAHGSSTIAW